MYTIVTELVCGVWSLDYDALNVRDCDEREFRRFKTVFIFEDVRIFPVKLAYNRTSYRELALISGS